MKPLLILLAATISLTIFGFVMIYSASSVTALNSEIYGNNPAFFVQRQMLVAALGTVAAVIVALVPYRVFQSLALRQVTLVVTALTLAAVHFIGTETLGATRWISIGGFQFQPSEFAKFIIIVLAAMFADDYFDRGIYTPLEMAKKMLVYVALPIGLVLFQPDKGTTGIIVLSVLIMAFMAGVDGRILVGILALAGVALLILSLKDSYALDRIQTMLNPWSDYYGDGYQLISGFYSFGTGGITGVGIGYSHQKYGFLPMAYNDFIFAIVGEECGFIGCVLVLIAFAAIAWAGLQIARHANDLAGMLIAGGCTSLFIIQLTLNVMGVTGWFPLSGKPVPFLSYGGTSIMSCLIMVGLLANVSLHSSLPETEAELARKSFSRSSGGARSERDSDGSFVGEVHKRSERAGFEVLGSKRERCTRSSRPQNQTGGLGTPAPARSSRTQRTTYERINLGQDARDRLRSRTPQRRK